MNDMQPSQSLPLKLYAPINAVVFNDFSNDLTD